MNLYMIGNEYHDNYRDQFTVQRTEQEMREWMDEEYQGLGAPYFYEVHGATHPESWIDGGQTQLPTPYKAPTLASLFK